MFVIQYIVSKISWMKSRGAHYKHYLLLKSQSAVYLAYIRIPDRDRQSETHIEKSKDIDRKIKTERKRGISIKQG